MGLRILILGGTTEARQLAAELARIGADTVTLSLAGRTLKPAAQPVPTRSGGFGGADGLALALADQSIELLVDATHPFAARISANAVVAAAAAGVPLLAVCRPPWQAVPGDHWIGVDDVSAAVAALGGQPRRVFLALGRQELAPFEAAPEHRYVVRSVDPVQPRPALPHAVYIEARGPFHETDEAALLAAHGIEAIVAKNSGGDATYGKIAAARRLGIEVILVRRPATATVAVIPSVAAALARIATLRRAPHAAAPADLGE